MDAQNPGGRSDRGLPARRERGPRQWAGILILSAWLVGWAFGEWLAIQRLFFSDAPGGEGWFLGLWLLLWSAGGALALRQLLRLLAGHPPPPPPPPPERPGYTDVG